ncbi:hypothetical protein HNP37_002959 [Flavobacterium nitrogenifigens]|uniref:DUF2157 domain-containing protein n=2 Tax=Flavobacterium TaxID=237 RepID=A0A7W7IYD5_9FLAO|nr:MULTISPECIES: hypothetical protein [Flavobacterium]MBB4802884.1 hypothetical protein [Flavobacterium nitrogenifigens]MBB6387842.1 hypothetical protein [Flavobacterium notoginsengisoli]
MIVHDKKKLDNEFLVDQADSLYNGGFISKEQKKFIEKELPVLRSQSNVLVRIGFFLLGSLLYSSICGMISLFGLSSEHIYFQICFYIFAAVGFAGAELLSHQEYHNHGLDDAFILGAISQIGIAIAITTEGYETVIAFFVAFAAFFMFIRYLHVLSMLVFCIAVTAFLFFEMFELGDIGKAILPFIAMIFAGACYFITKKIIKNLTESYYYNGLLLANSFCLALFYFSCNYLVVRELSGELLGTEVKPGTDIPFAFFFYAFTVLVPIIYLVQALKTKDRIMLWLSFLAIGFSIFTIRFYYSVLPAEVALTVGGLVLFAIAYFSIKKLKEKESGLTFKPDRINHSDSFLNAEALIVASTFGMKPEVKTVSPMEFGGGGFSGGGSGESF